MPYIETTDEVPIHYLDEGARSSSAVFLIHAGPFSCKFWQKNIPELSREFRVVAIDVRGYGDSGKTDEGHSFAQYARDMRHVLEKLGLEKVVAVGWSLGGSIIWSYIQQFGEDRLAGYVNVDQRPYRFVSETHFQEQVVALLSRRLQFHREIVLSYFGPEAQKDEEVVKWMTYECMKTPTSAYIKVRHESFHADYRPFLPQVRIPTRIFWAKYGLIQPDMAKLMNKAMPNSRLVFFEHSGHLLPWTEAEKFNKEVASFARKVLA